uniref:ATP synthase F1 complex delta/epsilon subunit N-terminal domain-containing protein n=1 Tax=Salix viminalis TaxID=40686 RepID=A0A6N2MVK9_SALVM
MLRQTSRLLARSIATTQQPIRLMGARPMSTNMPATPVEDSTFAASWKKVAPHIDPPKTPSAFMKPRPSTPSAIPSKITVNFVLPYASQLTSKEAHEIRAVCLCSHLALGSSFDLDTLLMVDMVIIPATTGQMGVLPGHVPTIAELKPGVLSVHEGNDVKKYFLSSGFVFVHANSVADIVVVEAVPVDRIDQNLVQKGLADFTQKLSSATTELEKAEAQIGIDVHSALSSALAG